MSRPKFRCWSIFVLWFFVCVLASASAAAQTTVIRAGHVIDPGTGQASGAQSIVIKDGKIVSVGAGVRVPEGAEVVDLSSAWVMPGLM